MNTHAIIAITVEGHALELGRLGSLERAVAFGRRLQDELGDEFTRFEYLELDQEREFLEELACVFRRERELEAREAGSKGERLV